MAVSDKKQQITVLLNKEDTPLSSPQIAQKLEQFNSQNIPQRTLRRYLVALVEEGKLTRTGKKRATKYQVTSAQIKTAGDLISELIYSIKSPDGEYQVPHLKFLDKIPKHRRAHVLSHLRDLWTHTSTALEGNTLSLGDTHFLLEEGLTVDGKPLREHQEIIGHARAIELIYSQVRNPKTKLNINSEFLFALHKAVQTEVVTDIYKPNGAWKVEVNGVYAQNKQCELIFIEFCEPQHVDRLMQECIDFINQVDVTKIDLESAPAYYAKVHLGVSQIHPFWDGNGRVARLLANLLLLKSGLPPLIIDAKKRRLYIEILSRYSIHVSQLTPQSGVWPDEKSMHEFIDFCTVSYEQTKKVIDTAMVY